MTDTASTVGNSAVFWGLLILMVCLCVCFGSDASPNLSNLDCCYSIFCCGCCWDKYFWEDVHDWIDDRKRQLGYETNSDNNVVTDNDYQQSPSFAADDGVLACTEMSNAAAGFGTTSPPPCSMARDIEDYCESDVPYFRQES